MDHQPGATHEALPLDPENDIDAGKCVDEAEVHQAIEALLAR